MDGRTQSRPAGSTMMREAWQHQRPERERIYIPTRRDPVRSARLDNARLVVVATTWLAIRSLLAIRQTSDRFRPAYSPLLTYASRQQWGGEREGHFRYERIRFVHFLRWISLREILITSSFFRHTPYVSSLDGLFSIRTDTHIVSPATGSVTRRLPQLAKFLFCYMWLARRVQRASTVMHCVHAVLLAAAGQRPTMWCSPSIPSSTKYHNCTII